MTPAQRAAIHPAARDEAHPGVVAFGLLAVLGLGCALGWAGRGEAAPRVETRTVREVVVEPAEPVADDARVAPLAASLLAAWPSYLDAETAELHARSALAAADATGLDPATMLGMAYVESRFSPHALSWMHCEGSSCKRRTGVWSGDEPPPRARPSWYCGALQVGGHVPWSYCLLMRDVPTVYVLAAAHLVKWMGAKECRRLPEAERLVCGLRGYNGGWAAIRAEASEYPSAVMAAARRVR